MIINSWVVKQLLYNILKIYIIVDVIFIDYKVDR